MAPKEEDFGSVYQSFKPIAVLGLLTGDFPIKNVLFGRESDELRFKKLSFPLLWSFVVFVFKTTAVACLSILLAGIVSKTEEVFNKKLFWPLIMIVACTVSLGLITHLVNMSYMPKLMRMLQVVDGYDRKFPSSRIGTRLLSRGVWICMLLSLLIVYGVPAYAYHKLNRAGRRIPEYTFEAFVADDWRKSLVGMIGLVILEFGGLLHCTSLLYISNVMLQRLENILPASRDVKSQNTCSIEPEPVTSIHAQDLWFQKQIIYKGRAARVVSKQRSWSHAVDQYFEFLEIFAKYTHCVGLPFIYLYLTRTLLLICTTFALVDASTHELLKDCSLEFQGVVILSLFQVLCLADIGERFSAQYCKMVETLSKLSSSVSRGKEERSELKQLLTIVMANPVRLSAKGFFTVSRSNVTSILSVMLTYLVVLSQLVNSGPAELVPLGAALRNSSGNIINAADAEGN